MPEHLDITHYTDPICPYAFSAEPLLRRLEWQLGGNATWQIRLVGLAESEEDLVARGLTSEMMTTIYGDFGDRYGMPIDRAPRSRLVPSLPACRAITAAGFTSPEALARMTRALRVRHFAGEMIDQPDALRGAAADAGLDPDEVARQAGTQVTADTLADDMEASRTPSPEAVAQRARLAAWERGLRYTCPSLEITRRSDGRRISAPGFQPREAYEMAVANLAPDLKLRPFAESVREVLEWAPFPLATVEIAAIRDADIDGVREELRTLEAHLTPVGPDGYWTLPEMS